MTISFDKEAILKLLEEDREFRYALMGLLGFKEILDRITRIEERQQRLEERFAKLEERQQRLEERFAQLEERFARLEERQQKLEEKFAELEEKFARLEERQQKLEERFAKLEERFLRLEERQQKLEERFIRLEEEMKETKRILAVIAHRYGVLTEEGLREVLKYVVEETLGVAKVKKMSIDDDKGIVYGHPSKIDIDVAIYDKTHFIIEIKSRASRADIYELYKIGKLYEMKTGIKPKLVMVAGFVDEKALILAERYGIMVKPLIKTPFII